MKYLSRNRIHIIILLQYNDLEIEIPLVLGVDVTMQLYIVVKPVNTSAQRKRIPLFL